MPTTAPTADSPAQPATPGRYADLTGHTFGQLHVTGLGCRKNRHAYWLCRCLSCGGTATAYGWELRRGLVTACPTCRAALRPARPTGAERKPRRARTAREPEPEVYAVMAADTGRGREGTAGCDTAAYDAPLDHFGDIRPLREFAALWGQLPPAVLVARVEMGLPPTVWPTPHIEAEMPDWWAPFLNPHWPADPPTGPCTCLSCRLHPPLTPRPLTGPAPYRLLPGAGRI